MYREKRNVLKVLNKMRDKPFSDTELRNATKIFDREKMTKLCCELKSEGFLDSFLHNQNTIISIELSYKGIIYKQIIRTEILKSCFAWFSEHILELAALILSLIALLRTL